MTFSRELTPLSWRHNWCPMMQVSLVPNYVLTSICSIIDVLSWNPPLLIFPSVIRIASSLCPLEAMTSLVQMHAKCKNGKWIWKKKKAKPISRVFGEGESRDKAARKKPSSSVCPPRSLSQQSPWDAIHTPWSKDSHQRPLGQSFRRDFQKSSYRPKQSSSFKGQSSSKDRKPPSQQYRSSNGGQSVGQGSALKVKEKASQQSRSFYKKERGGGGNQQK